MKKLINKQSNRPLLSWEKILFAPFYKANLHSHFILIDWMAVNA